MTAELVIMNRHAVALASDSAVTLTFGDDNKVFNTANKLHLLTEGAPVGVMVYGASELHRVAWETLVKLYRQSRGGKTFGTLAEYADDLIEFIHGNSSFFPESEQRRSILLQVRAVYDWLEQQISQSVNELAREKGEVSRRSLKIMAARHINPFYMGLREFEYLDGWGAGDARKIKQEFGSDFEKLRDEYFNPKNLSDVSSRRLISIAVDLVVRSYTSGEGSGVVVAGYGEDEIFPSLKAFDIQGIVMNRLMYQTIRDVSITTDMGAYLAPFAQSEMVATFMDGADPEYLRFTDALIEKSLAGIPEAVASVLPNLPAKLRRSLEAASGGLARQMSEVLEGYRRRNHVDPVIDTVSFMPKEEMAQVAEALVSLTSVKRRVTMVPETVGGPIDVAIITKGDGFVWIQRKHYFDPAYNPRFIAKYYSPAARDSSTRGTQERVE